MYPQGYFPFPDGVLEPFPKQFLTSDVVGLAKGIEQDGGFDRLNMLADAMMEAGYENEYVLLHLQQPYRPRMCACASGDRRSDGNCTECLGTGSIRDDDSQPSHKTGKGLDCGCWQGTCWVVQWILELEQKVLARLPAAAEDDDQRVWELPVINPADFFGRLWQVAYSTGVTDECYVVEAAEADDAIENWVTSEFGEPARIPFEDLKDYEIRSRSGHSAGNVEYSCSFAGDGTPYDSDNIRVDEIYSQGRYNRVRGRIRIVRYYGPSLPHEGVDPISYSNFGPCRVCGKDCHSITADLCVCSGTCLVDHYAEEGSSPADAFPETPVSETYLEDEGFYQHDHDYE